MKRLSPSLVLLALTLWSPSAHSFCGFYVAAGDAKLFNHASQVALVRDGDRTVMTMANDFKGEPEEFAIVVPVPTVLQKGQIHVGEASLIEHLDAFSAPRLVEYFDPDPCMERQMAKMNGRMLLSAPMSVARDAVSESASGVRIEARYTIGEYDILILSATESRGLESWLIGNGYRIPAGASRVLNAYIKQNLKFFVAKVNLKEQKRLGFVNLRPIQMAYESPRFMLPIRLGMANADGPQELFVYALTSTGRIETTNYRNVKLPTNVDVPAFVKEKFADFYRAMFTGQVKKEQMQAVFTEYAWDMSWCDPCASPPLSQEELRSLGVFWIGEPSLQRPQGGGPQSVFLTRLHLRYDREHFPEDLVFQETADRTNFQSTFVLHHEWKGEAECPAARDYVAKLRERRAQEANNLVSLTGWSMEKVRGQMAVNADWSTDRDLTMGNPKLWWQRIWTK